MIKSILNSLSQIPATPDELTALAVEAKTALRLGVPSDRIAYGPLIQHLSVREEEQYQRSIRLLHRFQQEDWLNGMLVPFADDEGLNQLHVYLLHTDQAHKVGRLRNSMVTPVFKKLMAEFKENDRVVPIIAKVAPGTTRREFGIIAYAKTDLIQFPTY
jgi:hypothetical protein